MSFLMASTAAVTSPPSSTARVTRRAEWAISCSISRSRGRRRSSVSRRAAASAPALVRRLSNSAMAASYISRLYPIGPYPSLNTGTKSSTIFS